MLSCGDGLTLCWGESFTVCCAGESHTLCCGRGESFTVCCGREPHGVPGAELHALLHGGFTLCFGGRASCSALGEECHRLVRGMSIMLCCRGEPHSLLWGKVSCSAAGESHGLLCGENHTLCCGGICCGLCCEESLTHRCDGRRATRSAAGESFTLCCGAELHPLLWGTASRSTAGESRTLYCTWRASRSAAEREPHAVGRQSFTLRCCGRKAACSVAGGATRSAAE